MKEFIGQKCNIHVRKGNKDWFYCGTIFNVSDSHICFKDKFGDSLLFCISDVVSIQKYYEK